MPGRKAKPPRLWFREDDQTWIILDRGKQIRTGSSRDDLDGAAEALETYIGKRHTSTIGATDPNKLAIADVLLLTRSPIAPRSRLMNVPGRSMTCCSIRLLDLNSLSCLPSRHIEWTLKPPSIASLPVRESACRLESTKHTIHRSRLTIGRTIPWSRALLGCCLHVVLPASETTTIGQ